MADLHSKILDARPPPGGPNSFNFMQFLGKFGKIVCWHPPGELAPPPRGNPRSATDKVGIITICNEVVKVMFLQVCVCIQEGGGIPACLAASIPACLAAGLQGGGIPACLTGGIPAYLAAGLRGGGACSQGGSCSGGCLLPGGCLLWGGGVWRRPPGQQMATVADGTHPTGMHSC